MIPIYSKLFWFFPNYSTLKFSKHYCKTILSTKKKNRKLQKNDKILPMATGKLSMLRACTSQAKKIIKKIRKGKIKEIQKIYVFVPNQIIAPKIS